MRNRKPIILFRNIYRILIIVVLFFTFSCEKKKYCIYHRYDLRYQYLLGHATKEKIIFNLDYNYSDLKNVYWKLDNKRRLDSLISIEEYFFIDTSTRPYDYGKRYRIEGECIYCEYYKTINPSNFCEHHEE